MLQPKKTIPRLATTALALAGCSGLGGGSAKKPEHGTAPRSSQSQKAIHPTIRAFCLHLKECYGYAEDDCTDLYQDYFTTYDFVEGCEPAVQSYFECTSKATCLLLDSECRAELEAGRKACPNLEKLFDSVED